MERLVQSELLADVLDVLRTSIVAGDDGGGVAGREPQQAKHEDRHDGHHRNRGQDALDDVPSHTPTLQTSRPRTQLCWVLRAECGPHSALSPILLDAYF